MIVLLNGFFHLLSLANKKNIIIQKLEERVGESDDKTIQVRYKRKNYPIKEKDIVYIESLSDYLKIVTQNQEVTTKMTMKNIEEELSKDFIRIHRSFIVGLRHISSFNKEYLSLGDVQLPISRTYKKKTIELLEK